MTIPLARAVRAMQATVTGSPPPTIDCTIDTRTLQPGQTYLALRGARFDGHDFVAKAFAAGAAAAIVDDPVVLPERVAGFIVDDTLGALMSLAAASRTAFCGAVCGITGSAGKTTTKEFVAHILRGVTGGAVEASPANENNEIGVSKVLLRLDAQSAAVVEMGARHFGDIAPLAAMARPDVGILTNIGEAHLEIFKTRERLAQTKWQVFSTGARPVLTLVDEESRERAAQAEHAPWFAAIAGDPVDTLLPRRYAGCVVLGEGKLTLLTPGLPPRSAECEPAIPGKHNLRNVASACAAVLALGMPLDRTAFYAQSVRLPTGRYERRAGFAGASIIHDAYNASPTGMLASLDAFALESGRRILVLGSMAELGAAAPAEHLRVGEALGAIAPALLFVGGAHAAELAEGARRAGVPAAAITHYGANDDVIEMLRGLLQPGDVVFVKGSRMYRLDEVVDALTVAVENIS